eukprot:TRINITY_DN7945_c2_g2_i1.p1 TRINITY_DN7945_c2_g2~~TRINITY_DN7945_c2_g2_i1.p1  ORF type:complete len:382 (+),score=110.02 TRINITY_DN7945_c2_g2_i1:96-1241(+)
MLHSAVKNGSLKEVKKILKNPYANVDERDRYLQTPLHIAIEDKKTNIVKLLISKNADIRATDRNGWAPLHTACNVCDLEIIQELLNHPKINGLVKTKDGATPMHYLVKHKFQGQENNKYLELFEKLIEKGGEIDNQEKHGETPLHRAVMRGNEIAVKFLLEKKCKVNLQNSIGETALHYAVRSRSEQLISLLMMHKCDASIRSQDGTAMELAIKYNDQNIQNLLEDCNTLKKPLTAPNKALQEKSKKVLQKKLSDSSLHLQIQEQQQKNKNDLNNNNNDNNNNSNNNNIKYQQQTSLPQAPQQLNQSQDSMIELYNYYLQQQYFMQQIYQQRALASQEPNIILQVPIICINCQNTFTHPPQAISIKCPFCNYTCHISNQSN